MNPLFTNQSLDGGETGREMENLWIYRCRALRAVDGDTVIVHVDHGMSIYSAQSIRLNGVNAPERGQPGWGEAKLFVSAWIIEHGHGLDWPLVILTDKDHRSFNRYVARVRCLGCDAALVDDILLSGHGEPSP